MLSQEANEEQHCAHKPHCIRIHIGMCNEGPMNFGSSIFRWKLYIPLGAAATHAVTGTIPVCQ
eukprot:2490392-Amphidinium_carterae.1